MPNPGEIANLGKFQMFLEMCEVTKTLGGKLPLDYTWFLMLIHTLLSNLSETTY